MTAAVETHLRLPSPVQSMPITTPDDLWDAQRWLYRHGVNCVLALADVTPDGVTPSADPKLVVADADAHFTLRVGQRLVRDTNTGAFDVWNEESFATVHPRRIA